MAKKSSFVVFAYFLVLVPLAIAAGIIGYRTLQKNIRDAQMDSALAARAKAAEETRHQKVVERESTELVIASQLRTDALRIKTLTLEDEIAGLNGLPAKNRIAIARLEGKQMADHEYKLMQDEMVKHIELAEKSVADPKPFPDLFAAWQASMEDSVDALIALRRANAEDDERANKAARQALDAARQRAVAAAEKYKEAGEAATRQPGIAGATH
jgi:hypothetical protein